MGNKISYGFILGRTCSGKTETSKFLANNFGYFVIDMLAIKKKLEAAKSGEGDDAPEGEN